MIGQILASYPDTRGGRQGTSAKKASESLEAALESASNPEAAPQAQSTLEAPPGASTRPGRRGRRPKPPEWVLGIMEWFADELHDDPKLLNSVVTRTTNLFQTSGLSEEAFRTLMFDARTRAKQRGNIQKLACDTPYQRNRIPYFFAVLESMLAELNRESLGGSGP